MLFLEYTTGVDSLICGTYSYIFTGTAYYKLVDLRGTWSTLTILLIDIFALYLYRL